MSLAGRIATRGSTVTVKRSTKARSAGGATNLTWAVVPGLHEAKMLLDQPDSHTVQRVFGQDIKLDVRATCAADLDVQPGDAVLVVDGWQDGVNFQVVAKAEFGQMARARHLELALLKSPETL